MSSQRDFWRSEQAVRRRGIESFSQEQTSAGLSASGLPSCGCPLRASDAVRISAHVNNALIDAKAFDERMFVPFLFLQYVCFPRNISSICVGFSTCARCEIASERDAIRAGAREIRNTGNLPHDVAAGHGLNQRGAVPDSAFPFFSYSCEASYAGRKAKRRKQQGNCAAKISALFRAMEMAA